MKIPFVGQPRLTIHGLARTVQSNLISQGQDASDWAVCGKVLGHLVASGCYTIELVEYKEGNKLRKSVELVRRLASAADMISACPIMALPEGHAEGMDVLSAPSWVRDERMLPIVMALVDGYGKKTYTMQQGKKMVTVVRDRFLMEHLQEWELDSLIQLGKDTEVRYTQYTDQRMSRCYYGAMNCHTIPTFQSGDGFAMMRLSTPEKVSLEFVQKVWIPHICKEYNVTPEVVAGVGTSFEEAVSFGLNPKGGVRSVGQKKRNLLGFIQSCMDIHEAMATGWTTGFLTKDQMSSGIVIEATALGSDTIRQIQSGQKIYESVAKGIKLPEWVHPKIRAYTGSRTWAKLAAIPLAYTSRFVHGTFIRGENATLSDEDGNSLLPWEIESAFIDRENLNPQIRDVLIGMSDDEIRELADVVNAATLTAFRDFDPKLYDFTDAFKDQVKNMGRMTVPYAGIMADHHVVAPNTAAFPVDPRTNLRDIPSVSFTIPHRYRDYFTAAGLSGRFQPTIAPFYKGEVVDGKFVSTGELNRIDTPSGSLVRLVSLADSRIMLRAVRNLGKGVVGHRHDMIGMRPSAFVGSENAYVEAMYEESRGELFTAFRGVMGNLVSQEPVAKDEYMALAGTFFR